MMKNVCLVMVLLLAILLPQKTMAKDLPVQADQRIFVFGGDINLKLVRYVVDMVDKPSPRVCYVPTASGDSEDNIKYWAFICKQLSIDSHVLKVWVSADKDQQTFEDYLLSMDAIVVGGGNTLNMLGIWKSQGIDVAMKKALEKGIILAGGSAGSICWFQNGVSDSRPVCLSSVDGLAFLPYSHCAHYGDSAKRSMYHQLVLDKKMKAGYACDELSGILFTNGKLADVVSLNDVNHSYYVRRNKNKVEALKLNAHILIDKGAVSETDYQTQTVNKTCGEFPFMDSLSTPLDAYITVQNILMSDQNSRYKDYVAASMFSRVKDFADNPVNEEKKERISSVLIHEVLVYQDQVAAVVCQSPSFYTIWFFYNEGGKWLSAGEDIGGDTLMEARIKFREKVKMHQQNVKR